MDFPLNKAVETLRPLITPVALLLTLGIFLLDLTNPLGFELEFLYLIPLLTLLRSPNPKAAFALATGYSILIFLGAVYGPQGMPRQLDLTMRAIVTGVLWASALLMLRTKRAEERLYRIQKEQQIIFDSVPAMIWYKDTENRILRANRTAANSIGFTVDALQGQSVYDLHPEDARKYHQDDLEVIRTGLPKFGIVEPYQTGSGEKRWIRTDKVPYRDEEGRITGVIVFATDITDSQQLAALEASMDGMAIVDPGGIHVYVNQAHAQQFGFARPHDLLGKSWRSLYAAPELSRFDQDIMPRLTSHGRWHGEAVGTRRDGSTYPQELSLTLLDKGDIICVVRDISERKRAEEALRASEEHLRHSQKMEAVGRLAGGIAHEFNNLLTVVMGHCHLLLSRLGEGSPQSKQILQIQQAGQRATNLTHQLLAFGRKQVLQPAELDVNAVVGAMTSMLQPLLGEHIELVTKLDSSAGWIKADRGQVEQMILNLVLNARDAMPEGGTLTIRTANILGNQRLAQKLSLDTPGTHVRLAVSDTGVGMDDYTKEHCFDPFFTTKGQGKGTGLGLATVYGIVNQSGGLVEVTSTPGRGSCFEIYLPQVAPTSRDGVIPDEPGKAAEGTETILLAEDEVMVRGVARGILESLGYTVLEAGQGQQALEICRTSPEQIHLLLTDVIMPGMNGLELAKRVIALRPQTRVLFMSGYTADVDLLDGAVRRAGAFLAKPFDRDTLGRKIRQVLDGEG